VDTASWVAYSTVQYVILRIDNILFLSQLCLWIRPDYTILYSIGLGSPGRNVVVVVAAVGGAALDL
jgi:hypothetical protein